MHTTHHVLRHMDHSSQDPKQQQQQRVLAASILSHIVTCSTYTRDDTAASWLHSVHPSQHGIRTYLASAKCPTKPVPLGNDGHSDGSPAGPATGSCKLQAPGLQLLLELLPTAAAGSSIYTSAVFSLAQQLLDASSPQLSQLVTAACSHIKLQPVWQLLLCLDTTHDAAAVGPTQQLQPLGQLILCIISRADESALGRFMQELTVALCQADSSGLSTAQQQHVVQQIMQLVRHAAGLSVMTEVPDHSGQLQAQPMVLRALLSLISRLGALQLNLVSELAALLLHEPLDNDSAEQLGEAVSKHWPIQDPWLRRQWWNATAATPCASNNIAESQSTPSIAAALSQLPHQQQHTVLQLLARQLQAYPADALGMPVQQLADELVALCGQQDQQPSAGSSCQAPAGHAEENIDVGSLAAVSQLLQLLDTGSGAAYSRLILHLNSDQGLADTSAAADHLHKPQQRLAVLQLLRQAMSKPEGATAVKAAMQSLLQRPVHQPAVYEAAVSMLLPHSEQQVPVSVVLQLLVEITGPTAALSVLEGIANHCECSLVQLLLQLMQSSPDQSPAEHTSASLLMMRLLPHTKHSNLTAQAVQQYLDTAAVCSVSRGSPQHTESIPSSSTHINNSIYHSQPQLKELKAFLEMLCRLDQQAKQSGSTDLHNGFLRAYLAGLLSAVSQRPTPDGMHPSEDTAGLWLLSQLADLLPASASGANTDSTTAYSVRTSNVQASVEGIAALQAELVQVHLPSLALLLACEPSTAAAAGGCLVKLLPGFSDNEVKQVLVQVRLSSSSAASDTSVCLDPCAKGATDAQAVFFTPGQHVMQHNRQPMQAEDFTQLSAVLMAHIQTGRAKSAADSSAQQLRLPSLSTAAHAAEPSSSAQSTHMQHEASSHSSTAGQQLGLVLTATTVDNINRVLDAVENPTPLLLEGPTGVGKSATVAEAAKRMGKRLIRFNMSSRITPEDLLARVVMKAAVDGTTEFRLQQQPFVEAYANGHWLLLDELNLAPDDVLQCIEQALDKGVITIADPSSASQPLKTVAKADGFRLFATQNPNAGYFKGRRELLSAALLDRFTPVVFQQLPSVEWEQVVTQQLAHGGIENTHAQKLAAQLVALHEAVEETTCSTRFSERAAYSEISIRELIKWVKYILLSCTSAAEEPEPSLADSTAYSMKQQQSVPDQLLTDTAYAIYAARFRTAAARAEISQLLTQKMGWPVPSITSHLLKHSINDSVRRGSWGSLSLPWMAPKSGGLAKEAQCTVTGVPKAILSAAAAAHAAVICTACQSDFIQQHGIYMVEQSWLEHWLDQVQKQNLADLQEAGWLGLYLYCSRLRHAAAKEALGAVFTSQFALNESIASSVSTECDGRTDCISSLLTAVAPGVKWAPVGPAKPFVPTSRVLRAWQMADKSMLSAEPLLLVGRDGCGKSESLRALAWLAGVPLQQFNLTPDTEPSALVGQYVPTNRSTGSEGSSDPVAWTDGVVTAAYKSGSWLCLDGLGEAEASVLERLNPLLESPSMWVLTEQGFTEQLPHKGSFRFMATMTPPSKQGMAEIGIIAAELSPAMYNRLSIIVLDDPLEGSDEAFKQEILQLVEALCGDPATNSHAESKQLADVCLHIKDWLQRNSSSTSSVSPVTLRGYVRLLDCCYVIQQQFNLDLYTAVLAAFDVALAGQLAGAGPTAVAALRRELCQILKVPDGAMNHETDYLRGLEQAMSGEHVLSGSRQATAQAVAAAITCRIPVLLEGPAAVGKTSLVTAIAKFIPGSQKLERVNNTESTGLQDYIGSYLPVGDGTFTFNEGPLLRCARQGHWLLIDELNLADPAVLSALGPLLEGASMLRVPGTDIMVPVHPGLRLFATQNSAKYANRHPLPLSIRSRFLEVQIKDFTAPELADIISRRDVPDHPSPITADHATERRRRRTDVGHAAAVKAKQDKQQQAATPLSKLAASLNSSSTVGVPHITLREIMKILRRHVVLKLSLPAAVVSLLAACVPVGSKAAAELQQALRDLGGEFATVVLPSPSDYTVQPMCANGGVRFAAGPDIFVDVPAASLDRSSICSKPDQLPAAFRAGLVNLAFAIAAGEPVMLMGPTSCKSRLVTVWAELMGLKEDMVKVLLSPETEGFDLIGQITPYTFSEALQLLPKLATQLLARIRSLSQPGSTAAPSDHEAALQQLLHVDFPLQLQQYSKDVKEAAATQLIRGDCATSEADADRLIADLLGLDTAIEGDQTMSAGHSMLITLADEQLLSDEDRVAAEAALAILAPDLCLSPAHKPQQDQVQQAADDDLLQLWDDAGVYDWDSPQDNDQGADLWDCTKESRDDSWDRWTEVQPANSAADADVFELLFGTEPMAPADSSSSIADITSSSLDKYPADTPATDSAQVADQTRNAPAALSTANKAMTGGLSEAFFPCDAVVMAEQADDAGTLIDKDEDEAASEAADAADFNKFMASLSLKQKSEVVLGTGDAAKLCAAASIPESLQQSMQQLLELLDMIMVSSRSSTDAAALQLLQKMKNLWQRLLHPATRTSDPMFIFRDGPVTTAAKLGALLCLEDFDCPSQAVTERLNSLLEPERTFAVSEDITLGPSGADVKLPPGFQVIATVHKSSETQRLQLSPATLSRFTTIIVNPYTPADLKELLHQQLKTKLCVPGGGGKERGASTREVQDLLEVLLSLTAALEQVKQVNLDVRQLLRCVDFAAAHTVEPSWLKRMLVAFRWFALDAHEADPDKQQQFVASWLLDQVDPPPALTTGGSGVDDVIEAAFQSPADPDLQQYEKLLCTLPSGHVQLAFTGVAAPAAQSRGACQGSLLQTMQLSCTPSLIINMARILAATTIQGPLLLEGPPGIGKTAVVQQVAALLGHNCARVNLSANTTVEQLLGSYIPKQLGGRRVFAWQDGALTRAVRDGKWLLLDELNLAPPEVLSAIAPLFDRDATTFHIPNSDSDPLDLTFTRVFATMNPASVGGGRRRLPRSVRNLFTAVTLQKPTEAEVKSITLDIFSDCLDKGLMDQQHAARLLSFHQAVVTAAERRDLGRSGAAAEFNLRDLIKVRDIIWSNMQDELHHIQLEAAAAATATSSRGNSNPAAGAGMLQSKSWLSSRVEATADHEGQAVPPSSSPSAVRRAASSTDLRLQVLCKVLSSVYASRFSSREDQAMVQQLIAEHMEVEEHDLIKDWDSSLECSIPATLRVGAVFLSKGDCMSADLHQALAHTPATLRKLEQLASASQSGRVVLLEGETCSGKTQLVLELARLAQRQLIEIYLTAETETTNLIGQWLPVESSNTHAHMQPAIILLMQQLIRFVTTVALLELKGTPSVADVSKQLSSLLAAMPSSWLVHSHTSITTASLGPGPGKGQYDAPSPQQIQLLSDAELHDLLQDADTLLMLVQQQHIVLSGNIQLSLDGMHKRLMQLQLKLSQQQQRPDNQGMSFAWVESLLVTAMREGHWVLLDNINSAPSEVIERLNSLFEDEPTLSLYEHSDGEVLSRASGTIHKDFRMFATSNPRRVSGHKMSTALLNRVVRICLLPLDSGLTVSNADQHDLLQILLHKFAGVHGGCELASLCTRFHAHVAGAVSAGDLQLLGGYQLTARSLLHAAEGALHYMDSRNCSPVAAAAQAIITTYLPGIASKEQQTKLLTNLSTILQAPDFVNRAVFEQPAVKRAGTDLWQQEAAELGSKLAELEHLAAQSSWALVTTVPDVALAAGYAKQVLQELLQPLYGVEHRQLLLDKLHDLEAAAASRSRGSLLEVWQVCECKMFADGRSICNVCTPSQEQMLEYCSILRQKEQKVWSALVQYIQRTSFADAGDRLAFLQQRVVPVLQQLAEPVQQLAVASIEHISGPSVEEGAAQELLQQLTGSLGGLLAAKQMLPWLEEVDSEILKNSIVTANQMADLSNSRAVVWSLQQLLLQPIVYSQDEISSVVNAVVAHSERNQQYEQSAQFKQLSVLLQFAAARWCSSMLLHHQLLLDTASSSRRPAITPAFVDHVAALSCMATLYKQLAAKRTAAVQALKQATAGSLKGPAKAHLYGAPSAATNSNSKKKSKQGWTRLEHRQQQRPETSNTSGTHVADAAVQAAADHVAQLFEEEDMQFLHLFLCQVQCQEHSVLLQALLLECKAAAAASPSTATNLQQLELHSVLTGKFGRLLQQSSGLGRTQQLVTLWCGVFFGLPVGLLSSLTAVRVLPVTQLADVVSKRVEGLQLLFLLDEALAVDDAAESVIAAVLHPEDDGSVKVHLVCSDSNLAVSLQDAQSCTEPAQQLQLQQHVVAEIPTFESLHEPLHAANAVPSSSGDVGHFIANFCSKVWQLLACACQAPSAATSAQSVTATQAFELQAAQGAMMILQHTSTTQRSTHEQAQELLQQVQQLHDSLQQAGSETDIGQALQQIKLISSPYELQRRAEEIEQQVQQLYTRHLPVDTLAAGLSLLSRLNQLASSDHKNIHLRRLKDWVLGQMGCVETYKQYVDLIAQLRRLARFMSLQVQHQLEMAVLGQTDVVDRLYATAPTATNFMLQLFDNLINSFDVTPRSIQLMVQHSSEQLSSLDRQIVSLLRELAVSHQSALQYYNLLTKYGGLLTAPVGSPAASASLEHQQDQTDTQYRKVQLDNAALRAQQKQENLAGLLDEVTRLLDEACTTKPNPILIVTAIGQLKAEVAGIMQQPAEVLKWHEIEQLKLNASQLRSKLSQHIKQLRANDPLYSQIPYLSTGMEQEDCSVPAAAWQREARSTGDEAVPDVSSHAVGLGVQLEELQAAFAQLNSLLPDSAALSQHHQMIEKAETLLHANMQLSSWSRAVQVCQQLEDFGISEASDQHKQQQLTTELSALFAHISPGHLFERLQHFHLSQASSSNNNSVVSRGALLPAGFLQQVVAGYAAYRQQLLNSAKYMSHNEVAELCHHLQEVAEGSSSSLDNIGGTMIGQYDKLQLLYQQAAALTEGINSGMARCTAVLQPVGITFLDAAAFVAPLDQHLLLKMAKCREAEQQMPAAQELQGMDVASFVYSTADGSALEVFGASDWLQDWKKGLSAVQTTSTAASTTQLLQSQVSAAVMVAAACAAAARSMNGNSLQLQTIAAVRTSDQNLAVLQRQLVDIDAQSKVAQNAINKINNSRELAELRGDLAELQQQRQREAAAMEAMMYAPTPAQQKKLQKLDQVIKEHIDKLQHSSASLEKHKDDLAHLDSKRQQLQQSADKAQQVYAEQQVQAAADVLLEVSFAIDDVVQAVAAIFTGPGMPAIPMDQASLSSQGDVRQCLRRQMQLAEAICSKTSPGSLQQNVVGQIESLITRLQDDCHRLELQASEEFWPGDPLAAGLLWLSRTLHVSLRALKSCMDALPQQLAFVRSPAYGSLDTQLPQLDALVTDLVQHLDSLVSDSTSRTASRQPVLHTAITVLGICQLQPQLGVTPANPHTLQAHTQRLLDLQLKPAAHNVVALQRLAVQLVLLCCRLARCHHASSSAEFAEVSRQATALARQLGLAQVVSEMPHEAAELQQPIKRLQQQLPYAAVAAVDRQWVLMQCCYGAVAGPVSLLQACQMQLQATGRALLPASYLGLRFVDCLLGMQDSLFARAEMHSTTRNYSSHVAASETEHDSRPGPLASLQQSVAAQFLSDAEAAALQQLLHASSALLQLDATATPEMALVHSSGASALLDDFKQALSLAVDTLGLGREKLHSCCNRLSTRGELLQKEVLKSEVMLVRQAFKYQVEAGQEEHLQDLQQNTSQLWQACSTQSQTKGVAVLSDIAGLEPAWQDIRLSSVAQLPSLLKLLEASGPIEAAGQLQPGSAIVLEWFGKHQVIEACLRHGIEGQGELLRSVYDFCPKVLRVSRLLTDLRRNALLGKQLMQQPLQNINLACASGSSNSRPQTTNPDAPSSAAKDESFGAACLEADTAPEACSAQLAVSVTDAGPTADSNSGDYVADGSSMAADAAHLLGELLGVEGTPSSTAANVAAAPKASDDCVMSSNSVSGAPFRVLEQLQHLEGWAFDQISDVVREELVIVISALETQGFKQRQTAVNGLLDQWFSQCDELVEARRLDRRSLLDKVLHQAKQELEIWRAKQATALAAKEDYRRALAEFEERFACGAQITRQLAAIQTAAGGSGWNSGLTELLEVLCPIDNPLSPLFRNSVLTDIYGTSVKAPKQLALSASFGSKIDLSPQDQHSCKSCIYAVLELPSGAGAFVIDGQQTCRHTVQLGNHFELPIVIQDPSRCSLSISFFGEPADQQHSSIVATAIKGVGAAISKVLPWGSSVPDISDCIMTGQSPIYNLVDSVQKGYFSYVRFGKASSFSGLRLDVKQWQYRPSNAAMATQPQTEQSSDMPAPSPSAASRDGAAVTAGQLAPANRFEMLNEDRSNSSSAKELHDESDVYLAADPSVPVSQPSAQQLQSQLQPLLEQLKTARPRLLELKQQLSNFSSVGFGEPDSPNDIEREKGRSIASEKEREQQELRSSAHTSWLHRLSKLATAVSEEVTCLAHGCNTITGSWAAAATTDAAAAATGDFTVAYAIGSSTADGLLGQGPAQASPQGAALHAAVEQLCQVLLECKGPILAADLRSLASEWRALPPLSIFDGKSSIPIMNVGTSDMLAVLQQHVPLHLQQLGQQLDAVLVTAYKSLGLSLCILAATASSMKEIKAAEVHFERGRKMLHRLSKALIRTDANAAAGQHVKYLEAAMLVILRRKGALLSKLQHAALLLQQAAQQTQHSPAAEEKRQLAAAMAAVTQSHDAEVRFGQLPDGQLFATPSSVLVNFGAQLTCAVPQHRRLMVINSTCAPLPLQLVDSSLATMTQGTSRSPKVEILQVGRQQLLIAPGRSAEVEVSAITCEEAGPISARYLLSTPACSSCSPVEVKIQVEYQHLAVAVDTTTVDFGIVPTYRESARHVVRVSNSTGVAVRIKSMLQVPYGIRSRFSAQPDSFTLQPYESDYPLNLRLHPSASSETIKDVKLLVAAGSAANAHEVLVAAEVQQPKLQLRLDGVSDPIIPHQVVPVPPLQSGQEYKLRFELVNEGDVVLHYELQTGRYGIHSGNTPARHASEIEVACSANNTPTGDFTERCRLVVKGRPDLLFGLHIKCGKPAIEFRHRPLVFTINAPKDPAAIQQFKQWYFDSSGSFLGASAKVVAHNTGNLPLEVQFQPEQQQQQPVVLTCQDNSILPIIIQPKPNPYSQGKDAALLFHCRPKQLVYGTTTKFSGYLTTNIANDPVKEFPCILECHGPQLELQTSALNIQQLQPGSKCKPYQQYGHFTTPGTPLRLGVVKCVAGAGTRGVYYGAGESFHGKLHGTSLLAP